MPAKGSRTWHSQMLEHEAVAAWYHNLARRNPTTADVYLRRLARVLDGALGRNPVDLLGMDQQELEDAVSACIDYEFQRGMLGSTVAGFNKAIKSFLKWHGRRITRDNTIPEADQYPNAESEAVPDQNALRAVLKAAQPRTAAMICVVAHGGQRLQVLGLIDASLGLRLGDFVDARVTPQGLEFGSSGFSRYVEIHSGTAGTSTRSGGMGSGRSAPAPRATPRCSLRCAQTAPARSPRCAPGATGSGRRGTCPRPRTIPSVPGVPRGPSMPHEAPPVGPRRVLDELAGP